MSVQLHRYDISGGMARQLSQAFLGRFVEAIWHTGIVVFGKEFYFDGGVGIVSERAGATRFGRPLRVDALGSTSKSESEFNTWVATMRRTTYGPNDYNLLQRNCNHFTQDASMFLLGIGIGEDIRGMISALLSTPMGAMVRPMLEQMTHSGLQSSSGPAVPPSPLMGPQSLQPPPRPATAVGLLSPRTALNASEVEELQISLALLESAWEGSDNGGRAKFVLSMDTLCDVLQQVLSAPQAAKYRRIKKNTPTFMEKILAGNADVYSEPVETILTVAGFVRVMEDGAEYFTLADAAASPQVLAEVRDALQQAALPPPPPPSAPAIEAATDAKINNSMVWRTLRQLNGSAQCQPFPTGFEGGANLYTIRFQSKLMGKASLREDGTLSSAHVLAPRQVPSPSACLPFGAWVEQGLPHGVETSSFVEVLCVPAECLAASTLIWVPLWLLARSENCWPAIVTSDGASPVVRSAHGDGVHPATVLSSTRNLADMLVGVPYGGACVDTTSTAEVLCATELLPPAVVEQWASLQKDNALRQRKRQRVCRPLQSVDELLKWSPPTQDASVPSWPWEERRRVTTTAPRLLVCHDFKGGYHQDDQATFRLTPSSSSTRVEWNIYTFQAWDQTDVFVYFSHARISIPPLDWITAGHRHGVPVLGTFITEGETGRAEWMPILASPQRMGAVIAKLVDVAVHYGFDGYLLNVENEVASQHTQRLAAFVKFLRQQLKDRLGGRGMVVWYDAVTKEGKLSFQNALNANNRCYFDAADAIFLNYFWRPSSLDVTAAHCGNRSLDAYVGVDCFGRSTYGGGGYDCDVAVEEVHRKGQSVALFAPGWTLERQGGGTLETFLAADAQFWCRLVPRFFHELPRVHRSCTASALAPRLVGHNGTTPLLLATFSRGAGEAFYIEGTQLPGCGRWVQRSGTSSSSLPSGYRCLHAEDRCESWMMPTMDDSSVGCSSRTRGAQLRSHPAPFFGDLFLSIQQNRSSADDHWVLVYSLDGMASPADEHLIADVIWRPRVRTNGEATVSANLDGGMFGVSVKPSPTCDATSMLTGMLEVGASVAHNNGWYRSTFSWVAPSAHSTTVLCSIQVSLSAEVELLDIGCVALGSSKVAGGCVPRVAECTAVNMVTGESRLSGSLQLSFRPSSVVFPVHLVATLSHPADPCPQQLYLGEHLVPVFVQDSSQRLEEAEPSVLVDVDIQLSDGMASLELDRLEAITAHGAPLTGWIAGGTSVWRRQ